MSSWKFLFDKNWYYENAWDFFSIFLSFQFFSSKVKLLYQFSHFLQPLKKCVGGILDPYFWNFYFLKNYSTKSEILGLMDRTGCKTLICATDYAQFFSPYLITLGKVDFLTVFETFRLFSKFTLTNLHEQLNTNFFTKKITNSDYHSLLP